MSRASPESIHELIFAIKQINIDILTATLHEVSDPLHLRYGQFLNRDEVAALTANPLSTQRTVTFLQQQEDVELVEVSLHGEYIKTSASVKVWERLLQAEFFSFQQTTVPERVLLRATIPLDIQGDVHTVFGTVQFPVHSLTRTSQRAAPDIDTDIDVANTAAPSGTVTPSLLNKVYSVASNTGSAGVTQGVFASVHQTMSSTDLLTFQQTFHLPHQAVSTVLGGHSLPKCPDSTGNGCMEANLDVRAYV